MFGIIFRFWILIFSVTVTFAITLKPSSNTQNHWGGGTFGDTTFEDVQYISSQFLENLFGHEGAWVPDRQKFVIADVEEKKWYFTLDNPYMNIGDSVFNLSFPVRRGAEYLYLPAPSLLRILNRHGYAMEIVESKKVISKSPASKPIESSLPSGTNILGIDMEDRNNGTVITVQTNKKLEMENFWVEPHFILKLQAGKIAPAFPLKIQGEGLVKNILTVQEKDVTQITLLIQKPIDTVEVSYSAETKTYEILVRKKSMAKYESPKIESVKAPSTIIIDPGHGGKDQGAQVSGVNEAQVTLAVAKELKSALTKMGYKALMTRETDDFISLPDRPKFASEKGGDLFISLHCNSIAGSTNHKKSVTGFTAYILREGESEEDKALARRENQAVVEESGKNNKSEISPVEWILMEHQLNLYSKESESFAAQIIKEFDGFTIGKYATGASQAGFYVLVGAYMPAVLFEMGFLTHDEDRRVLSSEKGQKQIAQRMANSIQKYRQGLSVKPKSSESKNSKRK